MNLRRGVKDYGMNVVEHISACLDEMYGIGRSGNKIGAFWEGLMLQGLLT